MLLLGAQTIDGVDHELPLNGFFQGAAWLLHADLDGEKRGWRCSYRKGFVTNTRQTSHKNAP
jgi:hypothetical protein